MQMLVMWTALQTHSWWHGCLICTLCSGRLPFIRAPARPLGLSLPFILLCEWRLQADHSGSAGIRGVLPVRGRLACDRHGVDRATALQTHSW